MKWLKCKFPAESIKKHNQKGCAVLNRLQNQEVPPIGYEAKVVSSLELLTDVVSVRSSHLMLETFVAGRKVSQQITGCLRFPLSILSYHNAIVLVKYGID